jgi:hypothetical protein
MNIIYYKEWVKTRWYLLLILIVIIAFTAYALLNINRIIEIKGVDHVWEIMISKDMVFVDILQYVPFVMGALLAIAQYTPEMYHKCLKLTLHLPYSQWRMINSMLSFGLLALLICFAASYVIMFAFLNRIVAYELYSRVLLTAFPWFLAGFASYLLVSWICLEPTWKRRVLNILISVLVIRVYFFTPSANAYNSFLPLLTVYTLLLGSLSWISIARFKEGEQD